MSKEFEKRNFIYHSKRDGLVPNCQDTVAWEVLEGHNEAAKTPARMGCKLSRQISDSLQLKLELVAAVTSMEKHTKFHPTILTAGETLPEGCACSRTRFLLHSTVWAVKVDQEVIKKKNRSSPKTCDCDLFRRRFRWITVSCPFGVHFFLVLRISSRTAEASAQQKGHQRKLKEQHPKTIVNFQT
ncbi:uncharacterized protein [Physcomitrium patens]|uniref:uncharacterized protein isoform X1 n=1 Tax=Physcomitrium patens TaxID=3218 RepID=UPI000D15CA0C|nr:uncharacterized protein LOC112274098 isoform X1 [Physcomitrium patens]|eukprot:XP_024359033.1 uncharacterized protein LOC112274098 isoform X1 [Physcomitrella patens]